MRRAVAIKSLGLAAAASLLISASAAAAPSLGVQIERDEASIGHSDERIDYTVTVGNTAVPAPAVGAGDVLACDGTPPSKGWLPSSEVGGQDPTDTFEHEWRRNGVAIPGAESEGYILTADDEGAAIQCLVTGTNAVSAAKYASMPPLVPEADPSAVGPPMPSDPTANASRPGLSPTSGTGLRTCTPPTNWVEDHDGHAGTPPVPFTGPWSYQWLRGHGDGEGGDPEDGVEVIQGESGETYMPEVPGDDDETALQCMVTGGEGTGGSTVGVSERSAVNLATHLTARLFAFEPPALMTNALVGEVTLEVELPGGEETYAFKAGGEGWTCEGVDAEGAENAKALCARGDALGPEASYSPLTVVTALGADAPDLAVATATVSGGTAPAPASDSDQFVFGPFLPFGISAFETAVLDAGGADYKRAGGHPFSAGASFSFNRKRRLKQEAQGSSEPEYNALIEHPKHVNTETPRGFVGNLEAIPEFCSSVEALLANPTECPAGSVVGGVQVFESRDGLVPAPGRQLSIFALEPEFGEIVQFAFAIPPETVYTFAPRLRADDGYAISLEAAPITQNPEVLDVDATICGFGAETRPSIREVTGCKDADDPGANPIPLITNPTRCGPPGPVTRLAVDTWESPGDFASAKAVDPEREECELVDFDPTIEFEPRSERADSPTGMEVELSMPTEGLERATGCEDDEGNEVECVSQANLKSARVLLPRGMAVNPSAGHGLRACTRAQFGISSAGVPNEANVRCPDGSKIGTVEVDTPLIDETFEGSVYVAKQGENPFGSLLALYMAFESEELGVLIKLAGKVSPDPETGRLAVSFDENPEAPFSSVRLDFPQGPRSPLLNPPRCGTYEIRTELSPWNAKDPDDPTSAEIVTQASRFRVEEGPGGGPCPDGALEPSFSAGVSNPVAGQPSPFALRLTREDGSQRFRSLDVAPPLGLTAYLKGLPYCPDAVLASISGAPETGQDEIDNPSCPAASLVGTASAGAGAGPSPFYVDTGKAYLAGPYKGAPLSLALVTPAVAGPIDLGNVVVRTALYVNPRTAQITAVSDPIPTILHGILLDIRDIRVAIDRPGFILNPTSCAEKRVAATVGGADGAAVPLATRFQVGGCRALGFEPRIGLRLFGGVKRAKYQGLRAVVRPRPGDANIGRTVVRMPRSAFLAQEHIRTICTRVQFAADTCPKGAIYGRAVAWSPLLGYPLRGNVYLRSSNNTLPDLVADLRGPAHQPIRVELVGRTDSVKGALRNTFDVVPDAPVSYFRLQLFGGNKGLIVNSRNVCRGKNRAAVTMNAQNGRRALLLPALFNKRCDKGKQRR